MNLTILSPDEELYVGKASSVQAPGISGKFEVLDNHAPIVAGLGEGSLRVIEEGGDTKVFHITKGFLEVLQNNVTVLVQGVKKEENAKAQATA